MRRPRWTAVLIIVLGMAACADRRGADQDPLAPPGEDEPQGPVGFRVVEMSPGPADSAVDVRAPVVVTFSLPVDSSTVVGALTLVADGDTVRGSSSLSGPAQVRFDPATPLEPGMRSEVTLAASLKSTDALGLDGARSWSFRTAGKALGAPGAERLADLVSVLADDSLRGRASGTGDEARAAEAIARDLDSSGVSPFGGPSFLSSFTAPTREPSPVLLASQNVLGVVPGSGDLADEWVVVGAHYDHLGSVQDPDGGLSVYHGADDNASGTALVLELARLWAAGAAPYPGPRRSLLFALWGAEERGLLGSCSFVESGAIPPGRIAAVFNFDMVGRLGANALRVPVTEPDSVWAGLLLDANRRDVALDTTPGCAGCSDHYCFVEAERPAVMFHTGVHDDYHKPTDVAAKLDYPGLVGIGGLALRMLWRVAVGG